MIYKVTFTHIIEAVETIICRTEANSEEEAAEKVRNDEYDEVLDSFISSELGPTDNDVYIENIEEV